jgi:hypothetical protein
LASEKELKTAGNEGVKTMAIEYWMQEDKVKTPEEVKLIFQTTDLTLKVSGVLIFSQLSRLFQRIKLTGYRS